MKTYFQIAQPIWGKGHEDELNSSLFFVVTLPSKAKTLRIAGCSFYRASLDGAYFAYGPSRDAHTYYRVDSWPIEAKEGTHTLVIEVSGYHCNSFYSLNEAPFIQAEVLDAEENVLAATGKDFHVYSNGGRLRKVTRFSYQRAFSESYRLSPRHEAFLHGLDFPYEEVEPVILEAKKLEDRIADYPSFPIESLTHVESGTCYLDSAKKDYEDRYQVLEFLKIFPKNEWEIDSNHIASALSFQLGSNAFPVLKENEFVTFASKTSKTGFIHLKLNVQKKATVYLLFDEVNVPDPKNSKLIGICFYRNTTHNCITYELEPGEYDLTSFEPYTLHYLRLALLEGEIEVQECNLVLYENPDVRISFRFENEKINAVLDAAVSTFAQNALDLLTDCPSRERAGWLCDSYFSGQAEPLITGQNKVEEAFLDCYSKCDKNYLPEGMIPCCYPADFPSHEFIPNWALWYVLELVRYQQRNGMSPVVENSKENVRGILAYFKKLENELGLLENLQGWIFVEWSKANDEEFTRGVNFPTNMLYCEALMKAGELLGEPSLIEEGKKKKKLIAKMAWNGEFFVDNAIRDASNRLVLTNHTTETCQYYAYFFGILSKEDNPAFFEKMRKEFGETRDDKTVYPNVYKSNVLMGIMMRLTILNRNGYTDQVFDETVEYFYKMASLTGTLWEHDSVFASLNHCFTSNIVNLFLEANFGLQGIDYKNRVIHFSSHASLRDGEVSIPVGEKETLFLQAKEGKLSVKEPSGYRLKWN